VRSPILRCRKLERHHDQIRPRSGRFGPDRHRRFAQDATAPVVADTDANGTFSLVEVQAAYTAVTEEAFKAADTDASGELSADELKAAVDAGAFAAA
jgi:hypothetical protein